MDTSEVWYCYLIRSTVNKNLSYNGSTNDPIRRLRQHNGEISGGAFRTHKARPWEYFAVIKGLPNHINALSCEWILKHLARKSKYRGIKGKISGLNDGLKLEQWTKPCKIKNKDMQLELYILEEYASLLDTDTLPENIDIYILDKIEPDDL